MKTSRIVRIAAISAVGALGALLPLGAASAADYPNPENPDVLPKEQIRPAVAANQATRPSTLPLTGTDIAELVAIGGVSVGVGAVLVRRSRRVASLHASGTSRAGRAGHCCRCVLRNLAAKLACGFSASALMVDTAYVPFSRLFRPALVAVAVTAVVGLSPAGGGGGGGVSHRHPRRLLRQRHPRIQAGVDAAPNGSTCQFAPASLLPGRRHPGGRGTDGPDDRWPRRDVPTGDQRIRAREPDQDPRAKRLAFGRERRTQGAEHDRHRRESNAGRSDAVYQPKYEAQHVYRAGRRHDLLDRVQAYDTYGDFVWVGPGTNHLTARNSTFSWNGRQGWAATPRSATPVTSSCWRARCPVRVRRSPASTWR